MNEGGDRSDRYVRKMSEVIKEKVKVVEGREIGMGKRRRKRLRKNMGSV